MLKASALTKLQRSTEALELLRKALSSNDLKLLSFARNTAFDHGSLATAIEFAQRIEALTPDNQKNRTFLVQSSLIAWNFEQALSDADALIADHPNDLAAIMLRAQALIALHRANEALRILEDALAENPGEPRLLTLLRTTAYYNGFFDQAVRYAIPLSELAPTGDYDRAALVHSYLAAGKYDEAEQFVGPYDTKPAPGPFRKEHHHFWRYKALKETAPVFVSAWELALQNRVRSGSCASTRVDRDLGTTMIQYWSQGRPPRDVQIVCDNWEKLLKQRKIGRVKLFDRVSAETWILDNAPEFAGHFAKAFHYAMESDIFRIAYASKRPCIYMDIDSWPLEYTADILRFAVQSEDTMLYTRAHRATIVNGFFVSSPDCPFIKRLVEECQAIDLSGQAKTYKVLESSFGPSRYSKVLTDLLAADPTASSAKVEQVPGCSVVSLGHRRVYFAHESAVASVRPPVPLGYKATDDYWKFFSLPN